MSVNSEIAGESATPVRAAWGAVVAMAFGVFVLVSAEFLPVSLLTPMAASLHVTEGLAGQTITATALVALLASLATAQVTRGRDRRAVMLIFFVLLIASCLLVTFAVNLPMILAARVLLGMAIGGFWTLSTAMAMRLVAPWQVPRALSIVFSGVSLATVFAAPLGSYLGGLLGWRDTFLLAAMLSGVSLVWLFFSLPSLPAEEKSAEGGAMNLLRRPVMRWGLLAVMLLFTGHFAFFTYLRPYLETGVGFNLNQLSLVLLGFGIANFFGTSLAGWLLARSVWRTLAGMSLLMSLMALVLVNSEGTPWLAALGVALWGLAFGAMPVGWSTWLAKVADDDAEAGGGLMVATIQFGITLGAAAGGLIVDGHGTSGVIASSGVVILLSTLLVVTQVRRHA
ncbi:MFS transporter [Pantoea sp. A4]|uniref:MFS transporter n=1 Tax=Pantoea sp. A4 TaxID=1225184 RepID=UPI00035F159B|nr:MFS transporter [Pantoea sp. A4]